MAASKSKTSAAAQEKKNGEANAAAASARERFDHLAYEVQSVTKTDMPGGGAKATWYRYEVANGVSSLTGHRRGTKKEVSSYLQTLIEQLNLRTIPGQKAK